MNLVRFRHCWESTSMIPGIPLWLGDGFCSDLVSGDGQGHGDQKRLQQTVRQEWCRALLWSCLWPVRRDEAIGCHQLSVGWERGLLMSDMRCLSSHRHSRARLWIQIWIWFAVVNRLIEMDCKGHDQGNSLWLLFWPCLKSHAVEMMFCLFRKQSYAINFKGCHLLCAKRYCVPIAFGWLLWLRLSLVFGLTW